MKDVCSKIVYDTFYIADAIAKLTNTINSTVKFDEEKSPVYICIMDGAVQFFADITRELPSGQCVYVKASSYGHTQQSGELTVSEIPSDLNSNQIFIFDDICDTGSTLKAVRDIVQIKYPNADVYTVALIDRASDGKEVPYWSAINTSKSTFFAGYGMDDKGQGRNLPFIYDCTEE